MLVGETLKFKAAVTLGDLNPNDVVVQVQLGLRSLGGGFESYKDEVMTFVRKDGNVCIYEANIQPNQSGRQDYALRILPFNKDIPHPFTPIYVRWEI